MNYRRLTDSAKNAQKHSYSPYSSMKVGAAILTDDGEIYTGCNIENSSFSLTICAERTALFKAVSDGKRRFKAIAISSNCKSLIPPCGACRQVIHDLAGNIDIVFIDKNNRIIVMKLGTLFPFPFEIQSLNKK
jgi:cytidine deaminase